MKKDKIIYGVTTALIVAVMLFSLYKMYTPDYDRLSLPHYLRTELTIAKILGLIVLVLPRMPLRLREWAYVGFGITLITASVAHYASGDSFARSLEPLVSLVVLAVSNIYMHRIRAASKKEGVLPL
jgi:hypothetical protein